MKNKDNQCFRWCLHIRGILNPQNNPQRIKKSDRLYIEKLNYENIEFPVTIKQIPKIEEQNNIRVNVFGYEDKNKVFPLYISKNTHESELNLLLVEQHYVLIKNFNKFMSLKTKHKESKHFCLYCVQCFSKADILENHKEKCLVINDKQAVKIPSKNEKIEFKNYHKQLAVPFVIYADFEAITEKIHSCKPNNNSSFTEKYQKHTCCSFAYKVVCCYDDKFSKDIKVYRGEDAAYKFIESVLWEQKYCKAIVNNYFNKPLVMTNKDEEDFQISNKCYMSKRIYRI